MARTKSCAKRGGNSLTALRLDPYYTRRLRGTGLFDFLEKKKKTTPPTTSTISAIDQEILHDLQYGIDLPKQITPTPASIENDELQARLEKARRRKNQKS